MNYLKIIFRKPDIIVNFGTKINMNIQVNKKNRNFSIFGSKKIILITLPFFYIVIKKTSVNVQKVISARNTQYFRSYD